MKQQRLLRLGVISLAILWLFTGVTSMFFSPDIGYSILGKANINGLLADMCVYGGGILDIGLGLWLLSGIKRKWCCVTQIAVIATYTLLLTIIDASFWLHPFGPITKNLPIVVLIGLVYMEDK